MKATKVSANAAKVASTAKAGTSSFRAEGRGSFNTTSFLSARPKSVAGNWAESQMEYLKQEPLWTLGVQNELLLTRPRNGIARIKTSRRNKSSSPENFQFQVQSAPVSAHPLYASKRPESPGASELEMSRSATPFEGETIMNRR